MKRNCFVIVMLMACLLVMPSAKAQVEDTMTVPFGCFEQWNDYPGDTMTLLGLPVPINAGYSLPEGWDIPRYNINDTLSYMGLTVPINTSIPLAKVYRDSVNAPEGSSALVAETFMFQDILDPMAYSLAVSLLDTSITNANIPSVAATGQVVVDKILPLMEVILDNTNSLSWMLDMLDTGDLNNYITGGFPLNGFQPGRLLGYYKYIYDQSYTSRDFGAVIALGTRYDTIEHRRLLVGAGSKTLYQLYDTVNYESFYMDYFSIGDYLPEGYPFSEADSMVVLVVSSIGEKGPYRGSRLFVDSLQLVQFAGPCGRIENLSEVFHDYYLVQLEWNNTATPDRWEVEYGESGFMQGTGTVMAVTDSMAVIGGLRANTSYDFYVHGLCGDTAETPNVFISVTTDTMPVVGVGTVAEESITLYPNPSIGRCMVDFGGVDVEHVNLFSVEGKLMKEVDVRNECRVELELPHAGIYIVELRTPQGLVHKRLVNK